jgi:hypothetical protein
MCRDLQMMEQVWYRGEQVTGNAQAPQLEVVRRLAAFPGDPLPRARFLSSRPLDRAPDTRRKEEKAYQ